jgi:hypothetical protein
VGHGDLQCSGSGCDKIITCACGGPRQDGNKRSMPTGSGQLPPPSPWTMWLTTGSMIAIHCCGAYGPDSDHDDILAVGRHSHRHSGFNATSARGGSTRCAMDCQTTRQTGNRVSRRRGTFSESFLCSASRDGQQTMALSNSCCRTRDLSRARYPGPLFGRGPHAR